MTGRWTGDGGGRKPGTEPDIVPAGGIGPRSGACIGVGTTVRGKISGREDLTVAGRLEGTLELEGTLTVEPGGVVKADVVVQRAVIHGIVVGNVEGTESVQLGPEARMLGDIHAPRISIADGARFAGAVTMAPAEAVALPAPSRAERPDVSQERTRERRPAPTPTPIYAPREVPLGPPIFGQRIDAQVIDVEATSDDDAVPLAEVYGNEGPTVVPGERPPRPDEGPRRRRILVKRRN